MGHCRLLFVGGRDALQRVYDTAPDSSSESAAELTIGADWIDDFDWLSEEKKVLGRTTKDFTIENRELYQDILNKNWVYCFDVRDCNNYGDFGWVNIPDQMEEERGYDRARYERNQQRIINAIKLLPKNTLFHFADSHW